MAYKEMNVAPTKDGGDIKRKRFEAKDELAAASNSIAEVKAGTETWIDQDLDAVAIDTNDTCAPVPFGCRRAVSGTDNVWAKCKNVTNLAEVDILCGIHEYQG